MSRIPAFLSVEEEQYLIWLAAEKSEGWGAVVDLGSWLGGSSSCLAEGLRRRGTTRKVESFDIFIWDRRSMEVGAPLDLPDGADFLPAYLDCVGGYREQITVHRQNLLSYRWEGGPIEILFVDAAKSWLLTNAILAGFGDDLVPGRSRVVLQDFRYFHTYWLPLIFDSRPDLWRQVESVEDGPTVTFVPLAPLRGPAGIHPDYSDDVFPLDSAEALIRARMAKEPPAQRSLTLRSFYRKCLVERAGDRARRVRAELCADERTRPSDAELAAIEDIAPAIFCERAWQAYERGDLTRARSLVEAVVAESGRIPWALHLLAWLHHRSGASDVAERYLDEAIASGDCPHAQFDRAAGRLEQSRFQDAERDAVAFLRQVAGDELAVQKGVELLERVWRAEGRADHGAGVLAELVRELERSPALWVALATASRAIGRSGEAERCLERALGLAPGHPLATRRKLEWSREPRTDAR